MPKAGRAVGCLITPFQGLCDFTIYIAVGYSISPLTGLAGQCWEPRSTPLTGAGSTVNRPYRAAGSHGQPPLRELGPQSTVLTGALGATVNRPRLAVFACLTWGRLSSLPFCAVPSPYLRSSVVPFPPHEGLHAAAPWQRPRATWRGQKTSNATSPRKSGSCRESRQYVAGCIAGRLSGRSAGWRKALRTACLRFIYARRPFGTAFALSIP